MWTEVALDSRQTSGNSEYRNGRLLLRGPADVRFAISHLQQGDRIRICARSESQRFSISIGGGGTWFYHFNPRVAENVLVQNSHTDGRWGREERVSLPADLGLGREFELTLCRAKDGFIVVLGKREMAAYRDRAPLDKIDTISLTVDEGVLTLTSLRVGTSDETVAV